MLTHLYLSPHLDDAVLSCGGLIHWQTQSGEHVVVVTICAGDAPNAPLSPFAEALHARWNTPRDAVANRRAEDKVALAALTAKAIHLEAPDCIYRVDPDTGAFLYASEASLFGAWPAAELPLAQRLAADISRQARAQPETRLYAPLGIGNHVDHQLTRRAAELTGRPLVYYEDYPYAEREPFTELWAGRARAADGRALRPERVTIGEADLAAQCRAVAAYASQLSTFWEGEAAMRTALRAFAEQVGGGPLAERIWR